MNTLILHGSPRPNGDTAFLIQMLCAHLRGDVRIINAYRVNIAPCADCRYCHKHPGCSLRDDFPALREALARADNVVLASPLYFSQLSGPLLSLCSRFQTFYAEKFIRKTPVDDHSRYGTTAAAEKKGALIVTAGGSSRNCDIAAGTARIILNNINATLVGIAAAMDTDTRPAAENDAAIQSVIQLAKLL